MGNFWSKLLNRLGVVVSTEPVIPVAVRYIPIGWKEVSEKPIASGFSVEDLEYVSFHKDGEQKVYYKTARERAKELGGNFGLVDVPDLCAVKVREGMYILLPASILLDSDGKWRVPLLAGKDGQWVLEFDFLEDYCYPNVCLVRHK